MEGQSIGSLSGPQRMQYDQQKAASTVPRAVNPSCFGNVEDVSQHSSIVAQQVERLVDRLCGNAAEASSNAPPNVPPNGLFEEADHQARYIRSNLARIEAAMNRLEKSLP